MFGFVSFQTFLTFCVSLASAAVPACTTEDDACDDVDFSTSLLQVKMQTPQAFGAHQRAQTDFDFDAFKSAFDSSSGVLLRVTSPSERGHATADSTTAWRKDLPLALYAPPRFAPPDATGVILIPSRMDLLCAYPFNAETVARVRYSTPKVLVWTDAGAGMGAYTHLSVKAGDLVTEDQLKTLEANGISLELAKKSLIGYNSTWDPCGVIDKRWAVMVDVKAHMNGPCNFASPSDFADAYYYKPFVEPMFGTPSWSLQYNMCHFQNVASALDAQKALLAKVKSAPPGVDQKEWIGNATRPDSGLTVFNEAVAGPWDASAVGAIFWAHEGPFRAPQPGDVNACQIGQYLLEAKRADRPIFELAMVNLQRPYSACTQPPTNLDCLRQGYDEWQGNLTSGGREASSFARVIEDSVFTSFHKKWCQTSEARSNRD